MFWSRSSRTASIESSFSGRSSTSRMLTLPSVSLMRAHACLTACLRLHPYHGGRLPVNGENSRRAAGFPHFLAGTRRFGRALGARLAVQPDPQRREELLRVHGLGDVL